MEIPQGLIDSALGGAFVIIGAVGRSIFGRLGSLDAALALHRQDVAEDYVPKVDYREDMKMIHADMGEMKGDIKTLLQAVGGNRG